MTDNKQFVDEELKNANGGKRIVPDGTSDNTGNCPYCNKTSKCFIVKSRRTYDNCKDCEALDS